MPKRNQDLNLPLALNMLDSYISRMRTRLSTFKKNKQNKDEKKVDNIETSSDLEKLLNLRQSIYQILYPVKKDLQLDDNQSTLTAAAKQAHLDILNNAFSELNKILTKYFPKESKIDQDFRNNHRQILDIIYPHIKATIFALRKIREGLSNKNESKSWASIFYSGKEVFHQFANSLGGSHYPINHAFDPFQGMIGEEFLVKQKDGICFGYVQTWAKEIALEGKSSRLFKNDIDTVNHQKNQSRIGQGIIGFDYYHTYEIEEQLDTLLSKISSDYVYRLSINNNHAAGIRKIPNSTKIEYFDANDGIFVFPDQEKFKIWFLNYFIYNYFRTGGRIHLYRQQEQPQTAVQSIPDITKIETHDFHPNYNYAFYISDIIGSTEKAYSRLQFSAEFLSRNTDDKIHNEITQEMMRGLKIRKNNTKALLRKILGIAEIEEKKHDALLQTQSILLEKQYIKDQSQYGTRLIEITLNALQIKIEELEGKDWEPTKLAFIELKNRIENAECYMTLNSVINKWLTDKPKDEKGEEKTYREIIQEKKRFGRPHSNSLAYQFVINLKKKHEINPGCNALLQQKCLLKISEMVERDWSNLMPVISGGNFSLKNGEVRKRPLTFKNITNVLHDYQAGDEKEIHLFLQPIVNLANKRNNFVVRFFSWRSQEVADFYSILQKLDINSPSSLSDIYEQLIKFEDKFKTSVSKKILNNIWEMFGIVGGGYLGATQGALLGAFIGTTIFPVIGTLIGSITGGVIGALGGGVIGSWLSDKLRWLGSEILNFFSSSSEEEKVHRNLSNRTVTKAKAEIPSSTSDISSKLQITIEPQPKVNPISKTAPFTPTAAIPVNFPENSHKPKI